jgi:hypothetical protein
LSQNQEIKKKKERGREGEREGRTKEERKSKEDNRWTRNDSHTGCNR